ncbi:MAG: hypothetical protein ACI83W_001136 [Marinoscillum sp.]|jgi:hypothetical protein
MIRALVLICIIFVLSGCYSIPNIEGFDQAAWDANDCQNPRINQQSLIMEQQEKLLAEGQAEIKTLFGQPDEHELYNRNQKFFYYNLSPDSCESLYQMKRLSIRFDALDRVKEVLVIE